MDTSAISSPFFPMLMRRSTLFLPINAFVTMHIVSSMKSFAKAIADCRKRGAKIGDPQDDPDVISFITNVISDNPAADPARKIWVSGCRTLASGNTDTQEGDSCSVELHYVCETHVKKKRVN